MLEDDAAAVFGQRSFSTHWPKLQNDTRERERHVHETAVQGFVDMNVSYGDANSMRRPDKISAHMRPEKMMNFLETMTFFPHVTLNTTVAEFRSSRATEFPNEYLRIMIQKLLQWSRQPTDS